MLKTRMNLLALCAAQVWSACTLCSTSVAAMVVCLAVTTVFASCDNKNGDKTTHCPCFERNLPEGSPQNWKTVESGFVGIENISLENYPKVDGSTSGNILNTMVACKLLGIEYRWLPPGALTEWSLQPNMDGNQELHDFFYTRLKTSQTHGAFINLINSEADIILTHRTISPDEKSHADAVGVTLIETSIGLDAFVFIINKTNPVKSLTVSQIQKIYTKEITKWSQVGGKNTDMKVFIRPRNSGSEEVFRNIVMNELEPADFPEAAIDRMIDVFWEIEENEDGICYSFNTYKDVQARKLCNEVPVLAINGICPSESTVKNRTYPFISEVHVAIRSDLDPNSMTYKLYEWLKSEHARYTITECGFISK